MLERSFWRPTTKSSAISMIPSTETRSNTARETILPRIRSSAIISTCPPSSGRNGSRLKIASDSEMNASSTR